MNQSDAERIATILEKNKIKPAASIDEADFVIFVTCGVRQSAEDRVYGQINNLRKKYPKKKIVLTGCLAHRKDVQRRLKGKVNLFTTIKDFPKNISKFIHNSYFIIPNSSCNKMHTDYLKIKPSYAKPYTAYVPIMTGCNNFCAYCVVPSARGREYSRPVEDILKEVKNLVKKDCKKIILLGQNVNSYNTQTVNELKTNKSKFIRSNSLSLVPDSRVINFPHLLRLIEKIQGKFWITFLTSHPKDMSDELIETIAKSKKICEYFSLPVQSGDNEILRKMNRHYTVTHYKKLVKILKLSFRKSESLALGKLPPAISTDIIVGFPGETKKQFENTAKLLREVKFDMAYISQYSPRPETAAWKLKDNVLKKEKARREKFLTKILEKTALENNKKYVGKVVEALVDKKLSFRKSESLALGKYKYSGHTRTQKKVVFSSNKKIPIGNFAKVKITKAKAFGSEGNLV